MLIVLTTTPNADEAASLARGIVEAKLAACVQILPKMTSVYFWEGKVQSEPEHLLLIKTLEEKFDALSEFIRKTTATMCRRSLSGLRAVSMKR